MKKIFVVTIVGVLLSGCVNPYMYRENQQPIESFISTKSDQEVAECILVAWQKEPLLTAITTQKTGKYKSVLAAGDNADIYTESGVTKIDYYSLRGALDVMNGKKKRISGIKTCI